MYHIREGGINQRRKEGHTDTPITHQSLTLSKVSHGPVGWECHAALLDNLQLSQYDYIYNFIILVNQAPWYRELYISLLWE